MISNLTKNCKICGGAGMVELEQTHLGIPITEPCKCVLAVDTIRNLERGWKGTAFAEKIDSSPLLERVNQDVYITANDEVLRAHLRFVGLRQGRNWSFLVTSDADLMKAWLYNVKEDGGEIYDKEIADGLSVSSSKRTLEDLVDPPGLLIIRLGVKIARNSAMGEVFHEALARRDHENRPTWVVDQPGHRLNAPDAWGHPHRSYSDGVVEHMADWPYYPLGDQTVIEGVDGVEIIGGSSESASAPESDTRVPTKEVVSFSQMSKPTTQRVQQPTPDPKKQNRGRR